MSLLTTSLLGSLITVQLKSGQASVIMSALILFFSFSMAVLANYKTVIVSTNSYGSAVL